MHLKRCLLLVLICLTAAAVPALGQRKRARSKSASKKPAAATAPAVDQKPSPLPTPTPEPPKRNGRPDVPSSKLVSKPVTSPPTHIYKFARAGFMYPKIEIRHDDAGRGSIIFEKMDLDEPMEDEIELSGETLKTLNGAFERLDFLNSTEDYGVKKASVATGTISITLSEGTRSRTASFSWTENPDAKILMDEYRKISNEFTWKFEMKVARENQPLETPRLMARFSSLYESKELSDPPHFLPLLKTLAVDEILPLIARNDAQRLVKEIEKAEEKRLKKEAKAAN